MKRLTTLLAALALAATQAGLAQPPGGPPPGGSPVERMAQDLNLTDAQKAKVQQIFDAERPKRAALREELQNLTPEQRRAKFTAMEQDLTQKLSTVLTPEQLSKYKQLQQERMQRMRERSGPPASQ